jgi:cytochrome c oxidase subunit 2
MLEFFNRTASSYSGDVDSLVWLVTILVGIGFFAAEGMLFWLIFRFRKRDGVPGQYITGKEKHLKAWINVPHAIVLVFDVIIVAAAIRVWVIIKQTLPPADRTIHIMSQQWAWTFADPGPDGVLDTADDIRTSDELHMEVGKVYHFTLESRDVVHSFFVPAFRLKQDAMPGRVYTGWVKPTMTGTYDIACTQICGIGHGVMGAKLVVEDHAAHAAWMQQHASQTAVAATDAAPAAGAPADSITTAPATAPATTK